MSMLPTMAFGLMFLGSLIGSPAPPAPHSAGRLLPVNLTTELSASMFHGTVSAIDLANLRVTVHTDFGRLVPVALENCEMIQRLRIGDRIRLDVDMQGAVRTLETAGARLPITPGASLPPAWRAGRCSEAST